MGLSGSQRQQLQEALIDAFPDKASLEQMLSFELDENLDEIASERNLREKVFDLIKTAQAENWVEDLIESCYKQPRNYKGSGERKIIRNDARAMKPRWVLDL